MTDISQLKEDLINNRFNPTKIQEAILGHLERASNGEVNIVDPSNPFVFLLEASSILAANNDIALNAHIRKLYPKMAETYADLYLHMADKDYLDRFASPSQATFLLYLRRDEILSKAVKVGTSETKKIVIPRYTEITVNATPFILLYPIEIKIQSHGGIQIVYDTDNATGLQTIGTNLVKWKPIDIAGDTYIAIEIPMLQLHRTVYFDVVNTSSSFSRVYRLDGQFYHCDVYGIHTNGTTVVYSTTHSEQVYDISKPTVLLRLEEGKLTVTVPIIYLNTGTLPAKIKIVIYTTKGQIRMNLGEYISDSYSMVVSDEVSVTGQGVYVAPFLNFSGMAFSSTSDINGGTNGLTFEQLRNRVIDNATRTEIPITESQLKTGLSIQGYDILKSIDNIMRRVYLATKPLPSNEASGFTQGVGCTIGTLQAPYAKLVALSTVKDNGARITLTPDTLYQTVDGIIRVVPDGLHPDVTAINNEELVTAINNGKYLYSPFYYVLDSNNDAFVSRPYHLDAPDISNRIFVQDNDTVDLQISTDSYLLQKVDMGYLLTVSTISDDNFKGIDVNDIHAQLFFKPTDESANAYINGTLIGQIDDEYVWEFLIETTLDVTSENELILHEFSLPTVTGLSVKSLLEQEFNLLYVISNQTVDPSLKTDIDLVVGTNILPEGTLGLTHEQVTLKFGTALDNLWSRARTVAGSMEFELWETDVPYLYPENVYEIDPGTGSIKVWLDEGEAKYNILQRQGDPVLNGEGEPVLKHHVGDIKLDVSGEPIIIATRNTDRQMDLFFVDGVYYYATDTIDTTYKATIAQSVVTYLEEEIASFLPSLHENTELYYYPKKTLGSVDVIIDNGAVTSISAEMTFGIRYYVDSIVYENYKLRENIETRTKEIINTAITETTVSVDDILQRLRVAIGEDVIAIDMDKLGPNKSLATFTTVDGSIRQSVKRTLQVLPNNALKVTESISVEFIKHLT